LQSAVAIDAVARDADSIARSGPGKIDRATGDGCPGEVGGDGGCGGVRSAGPGVPDLFGTRDVGAQGNAFGGIAVRVVILTINASSIER